MKIKLDCLPCIFRQVLESARMSTDNEKMVRDIMNRYAEMVPGIEDNTRAPLVVAEMQEYIKEKCGIEDPYKSFKMNNLRTAERLLPVVKAEIESAADPLLTTLIMSAMGNSIDAGISLDVDIEGNIENALKNGFTYSDYNQFKREIKEAGKILIIADNVGEAIFDRLLLYQLNKYDIDITYAVREVPVLNDITTKEALMLGLDELAQVISSGSRSPGMVMEQASDEFMNEYCNADIIISKGQGNLEGLSDVKEDIYYLLKAKCDLVARLLNVNVGDFVFILK